MKRTLLALLGTVGLLVGLGFILPAVAWWQAHGLALPQVVLPLILGTVLCGAAGATLMRSIFPARH